jgi:hypothetical protein
MENQLLCRAAFNGTRMAVFKAKSGESPHVRPTENRPE